MLAASERPLPSSMLFKTLSAAVLGIDAYVVEVEVDVGSAYMKDFNVVGLPDNAVKESRERIKAALRNCGIEFPYGRPRQRSRIFLSDSSRCATPTQRSRGIQCRPP